MATPALQAKERGNKAYKAKKFEEAVKHYDEAISLDATDITFYTNKGAVCIEQGNYDGAIETCKKAVEVGGANGADSKLIAKAHARIGKAYFLKDEPSEALKAFDDALFEHRSPDILKEKNTVKKRILEKKSQEYIDPEKSNEAKDKGNAVFKDGKYAEAIEWYTEAIKRNPQNHVPYSNRAAAYTKLLEFGLAEADCNKCIEIKPDFMKGYMRKANCLKLNGAREMSSGNPNVLMEAKAMYEKCLELDAGNAEAKEGWKFCQQKLNELPPEKRAEAAMSDPEIQKIMSDPAMQTILKQMQEDPSAAQEHLKNPVIRGRFQKLVESGIVRVA